MSNIFEKIEKTKISSNTFDLSHDIKLTTRFGLLIPICQIDTIPGDSFSISGNAMVRLAPTVAPVMHRADVYIHYFFVPNRLVWPNWEEFITGGEDGDYEPVPPFFIVESDQIVEGTLEDYFGIPGLNDVGAGVNMDISAIPFAMYQLIYEEYFRDQNMIPANTNIPLSNGDQTASIANYNSLQLRAWEHDYFTSALPWTQRGPEALLPLGTTAPLEHFTTSGDVLQRVKDFQTPFTAGPAGTLDSQAGDFQVAVGGGTDSFIDVAESHRVDLANATAASIIDLRRAFKLQEFLEKNARGGARYIENIAIHFGVESSDKRLNRPEYIGGFSSPVKMSEVLQTSETLTTPLATMGGHGISVGGSKSYNYRCEEHGYIIGLLSVLPKTAYQQGIHKSWFRKTKFDYAWPSFAHIGEQSIENREIYPTGTDDTDTWGYIPRYSEYKFQNNRVSGYFKSSLDFWHMGRKFSARPALNQDFVECDAAEVVRIFAVQTGEDELWCQIVNNIKVRRKLPVFGTPHM